MKNNTCKSNFKNRFLFLLTLTLLYFNISSCTDGTSLDIGNSVEDLPNNSSPLQDNNLSVSNGRVVFSTFEGYIGTLDKLSKVNDKQALALWSLEQGYNSLLNTDMSDTFDISQTLAAILNDNKQFQIGDVVISFKGGNLYTEDGVLFAELSSEVIQRKTEETNARMILDGLDARYQFEFNQEYYQPCGESRRVHRGRRKFVNEIVAFRQSYGANRYRYPEFNVINAASVITVSSELVLRVKLEWETRTGWGPRRTKVWQGAGEQRIINININGFLRPNFSNAPRTPINYSASLACSNDLRISLGSAMRNNRVLDPEQWHGTWDLEINGRIYQRVRGDFNNSYTISGLLW